VDPFAVIVYVEADEPPDSLPASSPAATVVCEGEAAAAVYESLAASAQQLGGRLIFLTAGVSLWIVAGTLR